MSKKIEIAVYMALLILLVGWTVIAITMPDNVLTPGSSWNWLP